MNLKAMKFKRVEIQAFKSYLNKQDGTFDFTVNGEPADIVSIYAPNGFGKTSFYDAIDFCITNNITRFIREKSLAKRNNEEAKSNNESNKKQFLLRAKSAPDNVDTTIEVITTKNEPFKSEPISARNGNKDYHFDDNRTPPERVYFRNLILAQESIDAFLRENTPEERYEKFMASQISDKEGYEYKRKIIQFMLTELEKRRGESQEKIKTIKASNEKIIIDDSIFSDANQKISELQLLGYKFSAINELFSEDTKEILSSRILKIQVELNKSKNNDTKAKDSFLNYCNNLLIYQLKYGEISLLLQQIILVKKDIFDIDSYKKLSNERNVKQKQFNAIQQEINNLIEWYNKLPEYKSSIGIIKEFQAQITQKNTELETVKIDISGKTANSENLKQQKEQLAEKLKVHQDLITNASKYYENIIQLKQALEINKNIIEEESKNLKINADLTIEYTNMLDKITKLNLDNLAEILSNPDTEKEIIGVLTNLNAAQQKLIDINQSKNIIEKKLDDVKQQSSLIGELIRLGADIISKTQDTKCPLCQYDYNSYEVLSSQINANPSLTDAHQYLIAENQKYQVQINEIQTTIQKLKQDFDKVKNDRVNAINSQIAAKKIECNQCNEKLGNLQLKLDSDTLELTRLEKITLEKTQIELVAYLEAQNKEITSKLEQLDITIKSLLEKIEESEKKRLAIESDLNVITGKLEQAKNNTVYLSFQEYLNALQIPSQTEHPELVDIFNKRRQLFENQKQVEIKSQLDEYQNQLNELMKNRLPEFFNTSSEELTIALTTLNEKLTTLQTELDDFTREVNRLKLENELKSENWQQLKISFEQEITRLEKLIESSEKIASNLELLNLLADKALTYINKIKQTEKIVQLNNEIEAIKKIEEPLKKDKIKVTNFLKEKIDEYFHTELINKIYSKIDPHPDLKNVKFECQMTESGHPKLLVYIEDSLGEKIVSPTLHFSSAQINVLSLSIFLAKALNTKDYENNPVDCIFIDDPIQSMDAINVLGVIDLIRNLAVNLGKQIIISTHDENFHELLKRKIPPNLFKSKFLELESFGKVKPHD